MIPYPNEFPAYEVGVLLPILRGNFPPTPEAVHAGWVVVGFGLNQTIPVGGTSAVLSGNDVADLLCGEASAQATIPWDKIIAFLLPLILEWLSKKVTAPK